jgi:hypothetical protein
MGRERKSTWEKRKSWLKSKEIGGGCDRVERRDVGEEMTCAARESPWSTERAIDSQEAYRHGGRNFRRMLELDLKRDTGREEGRVGSHGLHLCRRD